MLKSGSSLGCGYEEPVCPLTTATSHADSTTASPRASDGGDEGGTFITLGTSSKYLFDRLLIAAVSQADILPRPILVQCRGRRLALPSSFQLVDYLPHQAFLGRLSKARLVICHAGAGTIMEAMRLGARLVVIPRRKGNGESPDDHQLEFARALGVAGLIELVEDESDLRNGIVRVLALGTRSSFCFNSVALSARVRTDIKAALSAGAAPRIALVATSGGHLTELREIHDAYSDLDYFFVVNKVLGRAKETSRTTYIFPSSDRDWRIIKNFWRIVGMLLRERPGVIVSTGSGSTILVILIAKLMRARVIYIESVTRVERLSITGRVAYRVSDVFIARWPQIGKHYSRCVVINAL